MPARIAMAEKSHKQTEQKVAPSNPFPAIEKDMLALWQKEQVFTATLKKESPKGEYVFYDGPPFASGEPHYGHILAGTIKDVIPRFRTMQGYHVPRRWGWDCHGLPVENLVEKELGLKTKKDIEDYGIEKFNAVAKESVMRFADDWRKVIPRMGRFVDMENDYKTMDPSYTQSVWWAFKELHKKGLLYQGFKPMHICPRCETTLSNFEVTQGYQDIKDVSAYVKFKIKEPGTYRLPVNTFFVAWTTTPWTLPGNVALAVNADFLYKVVEHSDGNCYVVTEQAASKLFGTEYKASCAVSGKGLIGVEYEPLFPYYANDIKLKNRENGWKVYAADFVTTDDGTGVVHIAPAFGEDDMNLGQKEQLPFVQHVGMDGRFADNVVDFKGESVKPKGHHMETDRKVVAHLESAGSLFKTEEITHSYPHCWRCDTPLLNYAASSWFVRVTDVKDALVHQNETVTWVPPEVGSGRFGKWLEGARDWAISRSRFWGAPIPVWECATCKKQEVIGTFAELKAKLPTRNRYFIVRHGEAENNTKGLVSSHIDAPHHLTEKGKAQAQGAAQRLAKERVDMIITSPLIRTRETADIIRAELGLPAEAVHLEKRFAEVAGGDFEGKSVDTYRAYFATHGSRFVTRPPGGECQADVRARVVAALDDIDARYEGKTIVLVSHETPLWLMEMTAEGYDRRQAEQLWNERPIDFIGNAEVREIILAPLPHGRDGEIDVHRPYIDGVLYACTCGGTMRRVPEVFDCWFESGSMPYAESCFVGAGTPTFSPIQQRGYPADFIAEGLDQTRGWFYSLIVLGTALFGASPYKQVIVNGLILAENGQKMSKRLKNYPDPLLVVDTYGADALRLYLMSSPVVHGEDLRFSQRAVEEIMRKTLGRLHNCLQFLKLQAPDERAPLVRPESEHVLDHWVCARLSQVVEEVTSALLKGELDRAARPLHAWVDDLSVWYVRRSRDRFKGDALSDRAVAAATLSYVLAQTAILFAPFAPFYADYLFRMVQGSETSVHLSAWPTYKTLTPGDHALLADMVLVREVVSLALEARARANIKVRQPLAALTIKGPDHLFSQALLSIIAEEVNVKEVLCQGTQLERVVLDTVITPELKAEGDLREFIRAVQDLRKKAGLKQGEPATLAVFGKGAETAIAAVKDRIKDVAMITECVFEEVSGEEVRLGDVQLHLAVRKAT